MSRVAGGVDLAALPPVLPIFPLPDVLLLPGGQLPLNIFEPRYLAMVRDAMTGDRLIGMVQPRAASADLGAAQVYGTGCAGCITSWSETPDGRNLIALTGLIRFDVADELTQVHGYRRVAADYRRFQGDLLRRDDAVDRQQFLAALETYFAALGVEGDWTAIKKMATEPLVTTLAMACPFDGAEKQALLEALTLRERAAAMTAMMELAAHKRVDRTGGEGARH